MDRGKNLKAVNRPRATLLQLLSRSLPFPPGLHPTRYETERPAAVLGRHTPALHFRPTTLPRTPAGCSPPQQPGHPTFPPQRLQQSPPCPEGHLSKWEVLPPAPTGPQDRSGILAKGILGSPWARVLAREAGVSRRRGFLARTGVGSPLTPAAAPPAGRTPFRAPLASIVGASSLHDEPTSNSHSPTRTSF